MREPLVDGQRADQSQIGERRETLGARVVRRHCETGSGRTTYYARRLLRHAGLAIQEVAYDAPLLLDEVAILIPWARRVSRVGEKLLRPPVNQPSGVEIDAGDDEHHERYDTDVGCKVRQREVQREICD